MFNPSTQANKTFLIWLVSVIMFLGLSNTDRGGSTINSLSYSKQTEITLRPYLSKRTLPVTHFIISKAAFISGDLSFQSLVQLHSKTISRKLKISNRHTVSVSSKLGYTHFCKSSDPDEIPSSLKG
jgi:hypothetical protein